MMFAGMAYKVDFVKRLLQFVIIPWHLFYKMIAALGMEIKITKPTYYSQYDICNTPYVCEPDECTYGKK